MNHPFNLKRIFKIDPAKSKALPDIGNRTFCVESEGQRFEVVSDTRLFISRNMADDEPEIAPFPFPRAAQYLREPFATTRVAVTGDEVRAWCGSPVYPSLCAWCNGSGNDPSDEDQDWPADCVHCNGKGNVLMDGSPAPERFGHFGGFFFNLNYIAGTLEVMRVVSSLYMGLSAPAGRSKVPMLIMEGSSNRWRALLMPTIPEANVICPMLHIPSLVNEETKTL
jgi:hypothetical protein